MKPRVLLADDHRLLREAFALLLAPVCEVVASVADGRTALSVAAEVKPDIVILDIAMPSLNGLDAARQLKRAMPDVKIIFVTAHADPDLAAEAFRCGASGYVLKNSAASELLQAVKDVVQGLSYVTPLAREGLSDNLREEREPTKKTGELSVRQREVLQLLVEGRTMKQIARVLKITARTVAFHKYKIMAELGVKSSAELVQMAIKQRVLTV